MKSKETVKRYLLLAAGLFFSAFGVALTKYAELGVSPISSVANIASLKIYGAFTRQLAYNMELPADCSAGGYFTKRF